MYKRKLRTKCLHGHNYTLENTRISSIDGSRICRECNRIQTTKSYYKNIEKKKKYGKIYKSKTRDKSKIYAKTWLENNREKQRTHSKVAKALSKKILIKKPCKVCKEKRVDAHHPNYDKPLEVIWLCRQHHKDLHRALGGMI